MGHIVLSFVYRMSLVSVPSLLNGFRTLVQEENYNSAKDQVAAHVPYSIRSAFGSVGSSRICRRVEKSAATTRGPAWPDLSAKAETHGSPSTPAFAEPATKPNIRDSVPTPGTRTRTVDQQIPFQEL